MVSSSSVRGVRWGAAAEALVRAALAEDLGPEGHDLTTSWVVGPRVRAEAEIRAGGEGVVSGLNAAERAFAILDPAGAFESRLSPGTPFQPGDVLARLEGRLSPILAGERVALNLLQRLCGVATLVHRYVEALAAYSGVVLLDTRKTTPGARDLERAAVRDGGGHNHRWGLFDAILVKDNHIVAAGGVAEAVRRGRRSALPVEVEVDDLEGLEAAIAAGASTVLLDNMAPGLLAAAVHLAGGRVELEASGGMTVERAMAAAQAGVRRISVGALTHSAPAVDIGLEVIRTWS